MFFKTTLWLFIACALVNVNLAQPSRYRRDLDEVKLEESINELKGEIGKSLQYLTQNSEWMFNNVNTIFLKGLENVGVWAADIGLRMELLTMADGSHLFFPLHGNAETEKEYKTTAIAVSKLLMNLNTMERTDQVLKNVTRKLITSVPEPHLRDSKVIGEKFLRTLLHTYIEILDHQMLADNELQGEYKRYTAEAKKLVKNDSNMRQPLYQWWADQRVYVPQHEIRVFLKDKNTLLQGFVNKLFMKQ